VGLKPFQGTKIYRQHHKLKVWGKNCCGQCEGVTSPTMREPFSEAPANHLPRVGAKNGGTNLGGIIARRELTKGKEVISESPSEPKGPRGAATKSEEKPSSSQIAQILVEGGGLQCETLVTQRGISGLLA